MIEAKEAAVAVKIAAGDVLSPEGRQREVEMARKASEAANQAADAAKAAGEAARTAAEASKEAAHAALSVIKEAQAAQKSGAQVADDLKGTGASK